MSDPLEPWDQPFRSSFLCHLKAEHRRTVEAFGDLFESAMLEALPGPVVEPHNLVLARATLEDLDALALHVRETLDTWASSRGGETSTRLRAAMSETLALVEDALVALKTAVSEEEARQ
jgi:hypothetical protein